MEMNLDTSKIRDWRSIVTLVVFVLTNIPILWPFRAPLFIPKVIYDGIWKSLATLRLVPPRQDQPNKAHSIFVRVGVPINYITAPLMANLFLLAISAIGRREIHAGIVGNDETQISPYDIILVFLSLGYIANSVGASGLVRWLVFKVLQRHGKVGHRLYFLLYICFFGLGAFIGNDPIMLLFLSYLVKVSTNVKHPRAWIYTQFVVANIATGLLVSSNPTNLVLAGAFNIRFISFTANMIVPTLVTTVILFPFLLYIVFADTSLIPSSIEIPVLPDEVNNRMPINVTIPYADGRVRRSDDMESSMSINIETILNPFLDKRGATIGAFVMVATVVVLLALNAVYLSKGGNTDYWVTMPAAFIMVCWDLAMSWLVRKEVRQISTFGKQRGEMTQAHRAERRKLSLEEEGKIEEMEIPLAEIAITEPQEQTQLDTEAPTQPKAATTQSQDDAGSGPASVTTTDDDIMVIERDTTILPSPPDVANSIPEPVSDATVSQPAEAEQPQPTPTIQRVLTNLGLNSSELVSHRKHGQTNLLSWFQDQYLWYQTTFPTTVVSIRHLPFDIIPFAFSMFILVEALVSKGWVPVFAQGWDRWASKTGTVGCVAGMGFLGVILSNFTGTNIGACILLSRVIQTWQEIHNRNGIPISERSFWGTVYSLSLGVNYGAFSLSISASLTGVMWRNVLKKEHLPVGSMEFARVNLPIIVTAMVIACTVLVGQIYIVRGESPYNI